MADNGSTILQVGGQRILDPTSGKKRILNWPGSIPSTITVTFDSVSPCCVFSSGNYYQVPTSLNSIYTLPLTSGTPSYAAYFVDYTIPFNFTAYDDSTCSTFAFTQLGSMSIQLYWNPICAYPYFLQAKVGIDNRPFGGGVGELGAFFGYACSGWPTTGSCNDCCRSTIANDCNDCTSGLFCTSQLVAAGINGTGTIE